MDDDSTYDLVKVILEYVDDVIITYWTLEGEQSHQLNISMTMFDLTEDEIEWKH